MVDCLRAGPYRSLDVNSATGILNNMVSINLIRIASDCETVFLLKEKIEDEWSSEIPKMHISLLLSKKLI